ncbi:type II toxin-antitoxin system PemK/MazF family toxin [Tissierella creatinini]|nr:type II toxin-antitoxin system PemK/MazF family toxin [Tissierella creatinini]TJX55811.1 type II toxin-antitoxin system PemK/MazF family toxin [Soehngenia saccharolytica]
MGMKGDYSLGFELEASEKDDREEIIKPLNDLSILETRTIENLMIELKNSIDKKKYKDSIRYLEWLKTKLKINLLANEQDDQRSNDSNKMHPIKPKRGDIYLTQLGENIGKEINNDHLVLIIQNNKANLYGNTVVCIPISSNTKLYPSHEKIESKDIKNGRLDKLPSKAKTEQIHYLDKARLIHKVAELEPESLDRICKRLMNNLDVK